MTAHCALWERRLMVSLSRATDSQEFWLMDFNCMYVNGILLEMKCNVYAFILFTVTLHCIHLRSLGAMSTTARGIGGQ